MDKKDGKQAILKDLSRECRPAVSPLQNSYYQGVCPTPLSGKTIGQMLDRAADQGADHVIFKVPDYSQEITLRNLLRRSRAAAKGLIAMGLQKGDVVMLTGMADMESIVLYYAAVYIGLVPFQPCVRYPLDRYLPKAMQVNPSVLFVGPEVMPVINEELEKIWKSSETNRPQTLKDIIYTGTSKHSFSQYSEFLKQGETVSDVTLNDISSRVSTDDIAYIVATSGSSGEAKLVCQSHCYAVNCAKFANTRRNPYQKKDVVGGRNPTTDDIQFFMGVTQAVYNWREIIMIILSSKVEFYQDDITCLLECIQTYRMTWYTGYPFELLKMLDSPSLQNYDISSLRGVVVTAQMITSELKQRLKQHFPDTSNVYGSSEGMVSMISATLSSETQKSESVGYPFPHTEVKIVGDNNEVLPIGKAGEICTRGWFCFTKYLNDPETTSKAKGETGWLHLGDVGIMDVTGHIQLLGRKEECVVFKHTGDKVYPSLILDTANKHEAVKEAKVVGIQDNHIGHEICLFVQLHPEADLTEKQLEEYFNKELLFLECPTKYFILDAMPRAGARGKVHIQRLKEIAIERLEGQ
ncbi:putative acyl-CoA synthetase YngI [Ylistrum balloti]|uniref:putative acyl-CoA synthetase YngI n=1 Tax=Ylistrum balloti TaxID=509963 RepID=UPI002905C185|nr:putative acyl-CoA synthetase YngI [Ylistrum balloti]